MQETNYTELLNLFVNDDELREWSNKPFKIGDKVMATDAFTLVIVDAANAQDVTDLIDYDPKNVLSVIPEAEGESVGTIPLRSLRDILKKCPMVPVLTDCECCEGDGEVEYSFEWDNRTYEYDHDCPICDGEGGVPDESGKKEVDSSKKIKVGLSHFSSRLLFRLGMACKITNTETIHVVHQKGEKLASIFRINNADILLMPVQECSREDFLGELIINK